MIFMHTLPDTTIQHLNALFEALRANEIDVSVTTFDDKHTECTFKYYPNGCANMPDYNIARDLRLAVESAFSGTCAELKVFMPNVYSVRAHVDFMEGTLVFNFFVPQDLVVVNFVKG